MQRINTPDGQFHAGDPSSGVLGTIVTRDYMQSLQEEIAGAVESVGLVLDPNDNGQLVKAIKAIMLRTAPVADTGAVNAYAATNIVPLKAATLVHGVRQRITIGTTNTGASTYAPDGLPAKPIVGMNLKPLQGLELLATQVAELEYVVAASVNSGSGAWLLLRCGGSAQQLGAGTYGVTAPQFDTTQKVATMSALQRALGNMQGSRGIAGSASLSASDAGNFIVWDGNGTLTLPNAASLPAGSVIAVFKYQSIYSGTFASATGSQIQPGSSLGGLANWSVGTQLGLAMFFNEGGAKWDVFGDLALGNCAQLSASLGTSGYQKLPSGLIFQWTFVTAAAAATSSFAWPLAFPNAALCVTATVNDQVSATTTNYRWSVAGTPTKTGFQITNTWASNALPGFVFSIGY